MGKIKGWKKTKNNSGHIVWNYEDSKEWIYSTIQIYDVEPKLQKKLRLKKWIFEPRRDITKSREFDTKKQALDYAMNYMRSNPNG